jgi:hypothetical protein
MYMIFLNFLLLKVLSSTSIQPKKDLLDRSSFSYNVKKRGTITRWGLKKKE